MSFCEDCVTGALHQGTPTGSVEKLDGVPVYVATPKKDYAKDQAMLILPDVFGMEFINNQLLADAFAKHGIKTYLIDYLQGDAIPPEAMNTGKFDLGAWFQKHTDNDIRPPTDKVVAALKAQGVTKIAANGYCLGGCYVFQLATENAISVGITAHPSKLKNPESLEKLLASSKAPLLICAAEEDHAYGPEFQKAADEILGGGKYKPGFKQTHHPGCKHGFGVRADLSKPEQKKGKEDAFRAAVEWTRTHL